MPGFAGDRVIYNSIADSPAGVGTFDRLFFFDVSPAGRDFIDLSAIDANANTAGDDAFTFIGTGAFTGEAGQLRFSGGSGGFLLGDVNGDGAADLQIQVSLVFGFTTLPVESIVL